ncbi:hypothetical protein FO440_14870 [Mucilaginibacter corticis]|uniref:Uncharacterized protein n=1 Tax=Mucilaginibacter corticis TaxID=2597670 RepID=A0A556MM81_9SPHI|nr:hypothetical protein [Mucilaginibacter corticis]TSJ41013.1 hypothetical protein FO440_14870 [Mucilaginibacter corticis]
MISTDLTDLLNTLTGQLQVSTPQEQQSLQDVQQTLAQSLLQQNLAGHSAAQFSFEGANLLTANKADFAALTHIAETAVQAHQASVTNNLKVFKRDVPLRTAQLSNSVPAWAAGAKLAQTAGPFKDINGKQSWFDFYTVEKLIPLYINGQANPVLLFKAALHETLIQKLLHSDINITKQFTLVKGSIWIAAHVFDSTAPVDRYIGLHAASGSITLSENPFEQGTKLTINPGVTIHVTLQLDQPAAAVANTSPYGIDAREATYLLPSVFEFTVSNGNCVINNIGALSCKMYGQALNLAYNQQKPAYNPALQSVFFPCNADVSTFEAAQCHSSFFTLDGKAGITLTAWAVAAATIDLINPVEADGGGYVVIICNDGLTASWQNLDGQDIALKVPAIMGNPAQISIIDIASKGTGVTQSFDLWADAQNTHGTTLDITYLKQALFFYDTISTGNEALFTFCNANVNIDRPVKVNGEAFEVRTKNSLLLLSADQTKKGILLYDNDILADNQVVITQQPVIKPVALALDNALLTVSQVNGCFLSGQCDDSWSTVTTGSVVLAFGLLSYLPTLPDPYVANLNLLERQFEAAQANGLQGGRQILMWLYGVVTFKPQDETTDEVTVDFYFNTTQPAQKAKIDPDHVNTGTTTVADYQLAGIYNVVKEQTTTNDSAPAAAYMRTEMVSNRFNFGDIWDKQFGTFNDAFALLDVSSNANQLGVSFGAFGNQRMAMVKTAEVIPLANNQGSQLSNVFPFIVEGLQMKAPSRLVRSFMLPQFAWEPVFNLTEPQHADPYDDTSATLPMDPEQGFEFFGDDGGATRIFNTSLKPVALAPLPLVDFLVNDAPKSKTDSTISSFTLPFGLKAIGVVAANLKETIKPYLANAQPLFKNVKGGVQISMVAGNHGKPELNGIPADSNMFPGYTVQLNNLVDDSGPTGASNLGDVVTRIFNTEFFIEPLQNSDKLDDSRGVPVSRIDFSGYGASLFSNWLSPQAAIAATSQAKFEAIAGRTAHEVIQVKSILYPWGIRVVRTITVFRVSTGYVYRVDSGWKAESDGKFDFSYSYVDINGNPKTIDQPYEIHPGTIAGLFNITNIKDAPGVEPYTASNHIAKGAVFVNGVIGEEQTATKDITQDVQCSAVYFDADVAIENVIMGQTTYGVVSKKILGYVQTAPTGVPLTVSQFRGLLQKQGGSMGGDIDCVVDINKSGQQMRLNRFDVSSSVNAGGGIAFVLAARGHVILPKDGSWGMVQHAVGTGEVTPLADDVTVPLIRIGKWVRDTVIDINAVNNNLLRVANPADILRDVNAQTINFGFLQSTATQKALFLTPAFGLGQSILMSKTPPVFADAYRLMTGKGIFPNIGDADTGFGKAMALVTGVDKNGAKVTAFTQSVLQDGGKKVWELMEVIADDPTNLLAQKGLELLKKGAGGVIDKALHFDVPPFDIPLIDIEGLKIYIQYKTTDKKSGSTADSKINYDVSSFASAMEDQWKSKLNNISMVVDLGSMKSLMTIQGNFNAQKGTESGYAGADDGEPGLPVPKIVFSDALQPVIDLLQILQEMDTGDYAAALKSGLKIAMGNSGEVWDYKFEATKEIALVRFPMGELYYEPTTPLKLEASMSIGVYFNAALKVTTDPTQLLPTAGAFLQFHGGLSVMCVSLAAATIYAVGSVDVRIGCDTKGGPSLDLTFGFGAQIAVGLPVVGNVSVLYMVGVQMHADTGDLSISAFLLFRGQAELLGGLVGVTITIEAKGTIDRSGDPDNPSADDQTTCTAEVTFALDISIFLVIDISFEKSWSESRQIA